MPVLISYTIKEGQKSNIKIMELKTAFENQDKSFQFKCGKCSNFFKHKRFRVLDETKDIYQCLKCGYPNKLVLLHSIN